MEVVTITKLKERLSKGQASGKARLYLHRDTGQYWLIRQNSEGAVTSACHVDDFTDIKRLEFTDHYNGLLEAEWDHLEYVIE